MTARALATVLPVADLGTAVSTFAALLGVRPTFVDGDRWAQFDLGGGRLALSGEGTPELPGLIVKVDDLPAARAAAIAAGLGVGEIVEGPHEQRCSATGPGGWPLVLYAPVAPPDAEAAPA